MLFRRKNVLPLPSLQLRLIFTCFFFAACSAMLQAIMFQRLVSELFLEAPGQLAVSQAQASQLGMNQFFISIAIMFPFVFGLGTLITFRFAGPIVHFEKHLRRIAAGEDPGTLRLRRGDQLVHVADAINLAVGALRERRAETAPNAPPLVAVVPATESECVEETAPGA